MWPHRRQPTRLPRPWDSPGKNTGVGCHFLLQCMKLKSESEVAHRVWLLATPWTSAYQAPLSMGFSMQEYWSGVPLPLVVVIPFCRGTCRPRDQTWISCIAGRFFTIWATRKITGHTGSIVKLSVFVDIRGCTHSPTALKNSRGLTMYHEIETAFNHHRFMVFREAKS